MTRSDARELAVHLIYELDYTGGDPAEAIATRLDKEYYADLAKENELYAERPSNKNLTYIHTCVEGVCAHAQELDEIISQNSIGWNVNRISRLVKAALRLAIFEILYVDDVPTKVAINECLELTRKYEEEEVVPFVNGILGSFAKKYEESRS